MKKIHSCLCLLLFLSFSSCNRNAQNATVVVDTVETDFFEGLDSSPVIISYQGVLPCADCEGILTTITLSPDSSVFTITEKYLGKAVNDSAFIHSGNYSLINNGDSLPADLEFSFKNSPDKYYFKQFGDSAILKLDAERKLIQSQLNYTLKRI